MTKSEEILVQISEFVFTEIDGIKDVRHGIKQEDGQESFLIVTGCDMEFTVSIRRTR